MNTRDRNVRIIFWCGILCLVYGDQNLGTDNFDYVSFKIGNIDAGNCMDSVNLFLPSGSLTHRPTTWEDVISPVMRNQTTLLELHNVALNRAFFWSYIMQTRFIRPAGETTNDPGMMYYFLSCVADLAANPKINASSVYFSPERFYTSSFKGFFNKTLQRFAPRAYREVIEGINGNVVMVEDLGAFDKTDSSKDYTLEQFRTNEWYKLWLPDTEEKGLQTKTAYRVEIIYANNTNVTYTFYGPPTLDENARPVKWTQPYFDCKRLNEWLVGAVAPVSDLYPRHTNIKETENPTYTAAAVIEMSYKQIDINQCPWSEGNKTSNLFASTARCDETTECVPLHGFGFQRGGYQCTCPPGYQLPSNESGIYSGERLEQEFSYINGGNSPKEHKCVKIELQESFPVLRNILNRQKYLDMYPEYKNPKIGLTAIHVKNESINVHEALKFVRGVKTQTCSNYRAPELTLSSSMAYGVNEQLENQARMAVRLANFISAYLQINDPEEDIYNADRVADPVLTEDQMFGETLSILLADPNIWSAGIFWDRNQFPNRTFFAPYSFKTKMNTKEYKQEDLARLNNGEFKRQLIQFGVNKQYWSSNSDKLEKTYVKIKIRKDITGDKIARFQRYPVFYRAAGAEHGSWNNPYYDCDGPLNLWVITYSVPFFGWDSAKQKIEFKGVVTITVPIESIDINQCSGDPEQNAFGRSDKCDRESTYCQHVPGFGYNEGGYRCVCRPGFEYPYEGKTHFSGKMMEEEFLNTIHFEPTIFDKFKCRPAKNLNTGPI